MKIHMVLAAFQLLDLAKILVLSVKNLLKPYMLSNLWQAPPKKVTSQKTQID
jgi:hypothetical protein